MLVFANVSLKKKTTQLGKIKSWSCKDVFEIYWSVKSTSLGITAL